MLMSDSETKVNHILPDSCPHCGEVVRNDMSVFKDAKTGQRKYGHVQFACNYEIEIMPSPAAGGGAGEPVRTTEMRECRKGKVWPIR